MSHHHKQKNHLKEIFVKPAKMLDETVTFIEEKEKILINKKPFKIAEEYLNNLGPGLTTGASDDDPSGITTYSQTGAQYGLQLLWLSWATFPMMAVVQEMCARIGVVTGHGLAANIRKRSPRWALKMVTILLFIGNTFNISANLGAMSEGVRLIFPNWSFFLIIIFFAVSSLLLQIFTTYARYSKYLKYLACVLLAYIFSALMSRLNWGEVMRHLVMPDISFHKEQILLICGIFGTTISPYLFFWQTSQEVEEKNLSSKKIDESWHQEVHKKEIKRIRTDVWSGMFFSNLVMFFIIAACAGTLFNNGITDIKSATDAAQALRPLAGDASYFLFAIGIIGTGMLAIPVLAGSTSYAVSESFGWKHGLYRKLKEAYAFYGVIIISMILGVVLNFVGIDPVKALIYSAIANGIIAPFILFFVVKISSDKHAMGDHVNGKWSKMIGWATIIIMSIVGMAGIIALFY